MSNEHKKYLKLNKRNKIIIKISQFILLISILIIWELLSKYQEYAKEFKNVTFGGRLGEYKYYDMDKVIIRAFEVVKTLI